MNICKFGFSYKKNIEISVKSTKNLIPISFPFFLKNKEKYFQQKHILLKKIYLVQMNIINI